MQIHRFYTGIPFATGILPMFSGGCSKEESLESIALRPIPSSAEILFLSDMDTGPERREIYSMKADGSEVTRISFMNVYLSGLGIDSIKADAFMC